MRLAFAGTPEPAATALRRLIDSHHEVVAVITRPDARKGRGRRLFASPVAECAQEHGIPVIKTSTLKAGTESGDAARAELSLLDVDACPVVAFGALIPKDLLDFGTFGFINLHFSVLPQWRGAAPVQAAIAAGQYQTGVTTFRIDEGLDTGDVLMTQNAAINDADTAESLLERLSTIGANLLVDTLTGLEEGTVHAVPQSGESCYAPKITQSMARLDFSQPVSVVRNTVRAYTPAPGAWSIIAGQRVKIGGIERVDDVGADTLAPGTIRVERRRVLVGCGDGPAVLTRIQPSGKKMMNASDYARGARDFDGEVFQ